MGSFAALPWQLMHRRALPWGWATGSIFHLRKHSADRAAAGSEGATPHILKWLLRLGAWCRVAGPCEAWLDPKLCPLPILHFPAPSSPVSLQILFR